MINITYTKVRDVKSPNRAHDADAGIDLFVPNDFDTITLQPGETVVIASGIRFAIPTGYYLFVATRSSLARKGAAIHAHIVDAGYDGEVHFDVHNIGNTALTIEPGMKIAQVLLHQVPPVQLTEADGETVTSLNNSISTRGAGGFGSTGG
jgi:dUTP pyrophosphatase